METDDTYNEGAHLRIDVPDNRLDSAVRGVPTAAVEDGPYVVKDNRWTNKGHAIRVQSGDDAGRVDEINHPHRSA